MKSCPDAPQLRLFLSEALADNEQTQLSAHISECNQCLQTISNLVKSEPELRLTAGTAAQSMLDRIKQRGPESCRQSDADAQPTTKDMLSPTAIFQNSRYTILEPLGAGGMGAVYKAKHEHLDRIVALKIINPSWVQGAQAVERFQREMKAVAQLIHPNIVVAYDADQLQGVPFLAMEFVQGTSLSKHLEAKGRLPIQEACEIIRQTALGLQHAHEMNMVHRDIKPANLMITPQGRVKILDFGLARLVQKNTGDDVVTLEGYIMGTPDYIAPEQAADSSSADIRADIYSLGCTLYCLLSGSPPFPKGTQMQKILAHREQRPPAVNQLRNDVPTPLTHVIEKMMHKDREQRYQTPGLVAKALEAFCNGAEPTHPALEVNRTSRLPMPARGRMFLAAILALALLAATSLFYGGAIFRFVTNKGELLVDVKNPDVLLTVRQNKLIVHDRTTHREFELEAGAGEILVYEKGGIGPITTKKFTLNRGGKTTVTVTPEEMGSRQTLDRKIAQWALGLGALVEVHVGDQPSLIEVAQTDILPRKPGVERLRNLPTVPFILHGLEFWENRTLKDEDLKIVGDMTHLEMLGVSRTSISDKGLAHLTKLKNLQDVAHGCY